MVKKYDSNAQRLKRHKRVRAHISGTAQRPRLDVFRSAKNIYVQVIDDVAGTTLVSASSLEPELRDLKNSVEDGLKLGEVVGKRLIEKSIDTVIFDRNGYLFHGIVKSIADGARKAGVKF